MFSKLVKYECRSYRKSLFFILIALTCITFVGFISITFFDVEKLFNDTQNDFLSLVRMTSFMGIFMIYYFGIIACSLAAMIIIAIRYYKTMFTDQGYLTHTLPVSRMKLYSSKLLSSILFQLLVCIMIILSILALILALGNRMSAIPLFREGIDEIIHEIFTANTIAQVISTGAIYVIFGIVSFVTSIIILYASITLGQLFSKHRIIGAILFYFGITIFDQVMFMILSFICSMVLVNTDFSITFYNFYYGFATILFAIIGTVLFIITKLQLERHLNLE